MSMAIKYVDMQGAPVVAFWHDWMCEGELRYVRPGETTTVPDRLQQKWFRRGHDSMGAVCTVEHEWRDVPLVIIDALQQRVGEQK